ncbi:unnamed protein product [Amoebophrya sp. A120]|nr:unnamed protein product [Amoebophrya sp. A120]|eukprot:GSA120T00017972001.1
MCVVLREVNKLKILVTLYARSRSLVLVSVSGCGFYLFHFPNQMRRYIKVRKEDGEASKAQHVLWLHDIIMVCSVLRYCACCTFIFVKHSFVNDIFNFPRALRRL